MADETLNDLIAQLCDADPLTPKGIEDLILDANADLIALADRILLAKLSAGVSLASDPATIRRLSLHSLWTALIHQVTVQEVMLSHGALFTQSPNMTFGEFTDQYDMANAPAAPGDGWKPGDDVIEYWDWANPDDGARP